MTTIEKTIRSELPGKDNARLRAEVRRVIAIDLPQYEATWETVARNVEAIWRRVGLTAHGRAAMEKIAACLRSQ